MQKTDASGANEEYIITMEVTGMLLNSRTPKEEEKQQEEEYCNH